jgi:hypothetical protein
MDRDEQRAGGQCHTKGQRWREGRARAGTEEIFIHTEFIRVNSKFYEKAMKENSVCKKPRKQYIVPIPIQAVFLLSVNCVLLSYI